MTELYFWLFNRLVRSPRPRFFWFWAWCWRRVMILRSIQKHVERRNWLEAVRYLKIL